MIDSTHGHRAVPAAQLPDAHSYPRRPIYCNRATHRKRNAPHSLHLRLRFALAQLKIHNTRQSINRLSLQSPTLYLSFSSSPLFISHRPTVFITAPLHRFRFLAVLLFYFFALLYQLSSITLASRRHDFLFFFVSLIHSHFLICTSKRVSKRWIQVLKRQR